MSEEQRGKYQSDQDPRNLSHESEDLEDTAFFRENTSDDLIFSPQLPSEKSPFRVMSSNSLYGEDIVNSNHPFNSEDLISPSAYSQEEASTPPSRTTNMSLSPPLLHNENMSYSSKGNPRNRPPRAPATRSVGGGPPSQSSKQQQPVITTHVRSNHVRGGSSSDASLLSALTDGSFDPELPRHFPPMSSAQSPTYMNIEVQNNLPTSLQQPVLSDQESTPPGRSNRVFPSPKSGIYSNRVPASPLNSEAAPAPFQSEAVSLIAEAMKDQNEEGTVMCDMQELLKRERSGRSIKELLLRLDLMLMLLGDQDSTSREQRREKMLQEYEVLSSKVIPRDQEFGAVAAVIVAVIGYSLSNHAKQLSTISVQYTLYTILLGTVIFVIYLYIGKVQLDQISGKVRDILEEHLFLSELEYGITFADSTETSLSDEVPIMLRDTNRTLTGNPPELFENGLTAFKKYFRKYSVSHGDVLSSSRSFLCRDRDGNVGDSPGKYLYDRLAGQNSKDFIARSSLLHTKISLFDQEEKGSVILRLFGRVREIDSDFFCSRLNSLIEQTSRIESTTTCNEQLRVHVVALVTTLGLLAAIFTSLILSGTLAMATVLSPVFFFVVLAWRSLQCHLEGLFWLILSKSFIIGDRLKLASHGFEQGDVWIVTTINPFRTCLVHSEDAREVYVSNSDLAKMTIENNSSSNNAIVCVRNRFQLHESTEKVDLYRRTINLFIGKHPKEWLDVSSSGRRSLPRAFDCFEYAIRIQHLYSWHDQALVEDSMAALVTFGAEVERQLGMETLEDDRGKPYPLDRRRSSFFRVSEAESQATAEDHTGASRIHI